MSRSWFQHPRATALTITRFASIADHAVLRSLRIEDAAVVQQLMDRITHIPPEGDMMISFGPVAEHIELVFHDGQTEQVVEIYGKGFKTPSTGFNSVKSETEKALYADIDALLFPAFDKHLLLATNLELPFGGFTLTYLGSEFHDLAPATVSFNRSTFRIRSSNGSEQTIVITAGQLPPQPATVSVNGSDITLLTHQSLSGQRLYPAYLQVVRKV